MSASELDRTLFPYLRRPKRRLPSRLNPSSQQLPPTWPREPEKVWPLLPPYGRLSGPWCAGGEQTRAVISDWVGLPWCRQHCCIGPEDPEYLLSQGGDAR